MHVDKGGHGGGENNPHAVALLQLADNVQRQLHVIAIVVNGQQRFVAPCGFPRLADGVDKRIKALQGAHQQGDFFLVARRMNGGQAVVAEFGRHADDPLAGVVAELDVARLVEHQRYRRLRHARRSRNIIHRDFSLSLHSSSPSRVTASYPNCSLTRCRSRFSFTEA